MVVELKLFATFRKGRFKKKDMELAEGTLLSEIVEPLQLPDRPAKMILVDGIPITEDCVLHNKAVVTIFPVIAGG